MEEAILAEDLLEKIDGMLHQIDAVMSDRFVMTDELLHQIKEELEDVINV